MHNSKPSVSVVMPAYNSAKYIGEAIDSVLGQTYPVHEIIIIDDGSTDNTKQIVDTYINPQTRKPMKFAPQISNAITIKYIYQQNKGPAAARNNGIRAAKGDYIAFLDSDDIWLPEKTELQIKKFEENPEYCLAHTDRIRIGIAGTAESAKIRDIPEGAVFNSLLMENFICTSTVLVRKSCFGEVGSFDEGRGISEDYDMWLRVANRYKTGFINKPLIKYRISSGGYSRSNIEIAYSRERNAFLKSVELYQGDKEILRKERLHDLFFRMGKSLLYTKDYRRALLAFLEVVKISLGKGY